MGTRAGSTAERKFSPRWTNEKRKSEKKPLKKAHAWNVNEVMVLLQHVSTTLPLPRT
jgi:hypothetical protein